jgi:gliding motility-associated-like protein
MLSHCAVPDRSAGRTPITDACLSIIVNGYPRNVKIYIFSASTSRNEHNPEPMLHASPFRFATFALAWLMLPLVSISQTISYQNPGEFFICGTAPFEVTVSNTSGAVLNNPAVTVAFTTTAGTACGMVYLEGSVTGAQEGNLSDPGAPVFTLNALDPGASQTFTFQVEAPCPVVDCIDNAEFFVNEITFDWDGGSTALTSSPYVIERPLLVITAINSTVMTGSQGDVLLRKIFIRNTRPGPLSGFIFTDAFQPGIDISSPQGADISAAADTFQLALGGSNFTQIGDGDELFELNETLVVTEEILVTDCGVDITSAVSSITVGWGCGADEICQEVFVNAIVTIEPTTKIPTLLWEPITSVPECFCGPDGYTQGMTITNTGDGEATIISLSVIGSQFFLGGFIDTLSAWADSAGNQIPVAVLPGTEFSLFSPCDGSENLATSAVFQFASLSPGASVTIYWDLYFCKTWCRQPSVGWRYNYSYYKPCPPNPFIQHLSFIDVSEKGIWMGAGVNQLPSGILQDDTTYTVFYEVNYDSLTLLDDELTVEITLPCGMVWDMDNELILGGQVPFDLTIQAGSEETVVTARYQLPLGASTAALQFDYTFDCESLCVPEQVCQDSLETTCETPVCVVGGTDIFGRIVTTISKCSDYPLYCNIQVCADFGNVYECPLDSICIEQVPGYLRYEYHGLRKNYGLPDNDNDQFADGTGTLDFGLVLTGRFMTGDTIHTNLKGEVVIDIPGETLPYGVVQHNFGALSNMNALNRNALLTEQGIVPSGNSLRIFDSSSDTWYACGGLPAEAIIENNLLTGYKYDLSPALLSDCGLPPGFEYDQGDSILFEADYRIKYNLKRETDSTPLRGDFFIVPSFSVYNDMIPANRDSINCYCDGEIYELTGYEFTIVPGIFGLPPCGNSLYVGGSLFKLELNNGNFFPYEYRNVLTALDWRVELPPDIGIAEAKLKFLRLQTGVELANEVPLVPVTTGSIYTFDFGQFQQPPLEEGFSALFQYIFDGPCTISGSIPSTFSTTLGFAPGIPEPENPLTFSLDATSIRALTPNLLINAPLYDIISFNNQLELDFTLANFPTIVASQTSGPALNTWLYVTSASGLVTGFQLINQETGQPVPAINGVFQLGDFPIDTIAFRLAATNNSCVLENLEIHYGWNCTPFNSQIQEPCHEQVRPLTLFSPPGEIDFFVNTPAGCSDLCDTIPYYSIEIFNAQLGAVYDLTLTALLPPGITILPGSGEVEFPTGSGNFIPIGDPDVLSNGTAVWNLSALVDTLAGGLPGVNSAPDNSLTLRFLSITSCEFVANTFTYFVIAATQNCGIATNTVAKPGDPICITGVDQPYSTSIQVEAIPGFGCNDEVTFDVAFTASDTLPPGSVVIVTLPPDIIYEPGSCNSICQPNFNCTPQLLSGNLVWSLPAGIPAGQIICLSFNTTGWSALDCEAGLILFRTAAETQAVCASTGDTCSTKVSTGSLVLPFDPARPDLDLSNFMVNATQVGANDELAYSIDITNTGAPTPSNVTVDFYIDTDGNGSGDVLVFQAGYDESIGTNETVTLLGLFSIATGNLCNLVAYIDPEAQCACSGDSAFVSVPIAYQTGLEYLTCSGADAVIGVPEMPGFDYQWSPADCLSDPNAATTVFSCEIGGAVPEVYEFVLTESNNGGCVIENHLSVTLQPLPGIVFAETPICLGQSANLAASPGVSHFWQGPGIGNPNLQIQIVTPASTSTYTVTVEDETGCIGSDTVTVVVNPLPVASAGEDASFCAGEPAQLSAFFEPGYDYLWSPGPPALNSATVFNPVILKLQSATYSLTVTDENGCSAMDEVNVFFSDTIELTVSPDITICLGSSTILQAAGATSYEWSPPGVCQDPACSAILVSPALTTTYTVTATDTAGCEAQASVTVYVSDEAIVINDPPAEICPGETAIIFGEAVSEPGIYCDTILNTQGCDSVHCVEVLLKPDIDTTFFADSICQGGSVVFEGETLSEPGLHCVTLPGPNGCDSTLCLNLAVLDTPQVGIIVPDTVIVGNVIELSISPTSFDSILWSGGNITGQCTNFPTCTDSLSETGDFDYSVTVVGDNGCAATSSQAFFVTVQCDVEKAAIPNAFSPNGDGLNDMFTIVSPGEEIVNSMKIWNRFGQLVYEGRGPWDGRQNGKPAESDVYIYLIKVGCPVIVTSEEKVLKGDVTLLR